METFKGTTIVCVRRDGVVALGGDGQVTLGSQIVKASARKVRRVGESGSVVAGFAGSTADAMTLLDRFEKRLAEEHGNLTRAAVALVKEWRTEKTLRRLEAMMIVADSERTFLLSGAGDVLEPEDNVATIGSGSGFALAAARALLDSTDWGAEAIARKALEITSQICIYTNDKLTVEVVGQ